MMDRDIIPTGAWTREYRPSAKDLRAAKLLREGMTQKQVAAIMGVSTSRVHQRMKKMEMHKRWSVARAEFWIERWVAYQ